MPERPYPLFTFILCRRDEHAETKSAAFGDDAEAIEHGRARLLGMSGEWFSVVVARGHIDAAEFIGTWDRDQSGVLLWEAASLA